MGKVTIQQKAELRIQRLEERVELLGRGVLITNEAIRRLGQMVKSLELRIDLLGAATELESLAAEIARGID